MAKAKYADLVQPLRLWTEAVRPSLRGKMADFSLLFDEKVQPKTKVWIEIFYAYAAGTGAGGLPGDLQSYWKGKPMGNEKFTKGGMHAHTNFDELFMFIGTDPADNTRLGGAVEFWLGHGKEAQKFNFDVPTACWVPRNVAHNPWVITKVNDAKHPVMCVVIALTPTYTEPGSKSKDMIQYPLPPAFSMENIGRPQPTNGKYNKYVNRLLLSQTILIPNLRGRVCVPNLMFDNYVYRAPVWIELFLVYAGGQGVGVPNLEVQRPRADGTVRDATKGMQHSQKSDELFLFVSTDPHDTLNLGGEVVTYLGDEGYSITRSSSVWVPGGVPHNPQYYKRVDRPYYMIVVHLLDNAKHFGDLLTVTDAPKTFKF